VTESIILVELYSKEGCHLCEEARSVLERVQQQVPFTLREIKLSPGEAYFDEYSEKVPVVHINRVPTFKYRVNERLLRAKLKHIGESSQGNTNEERDRSQGG